MAGFSLELLKTPRGLAALIAALIASVGGGLYASDGFVVTFSTCVVEEAMETEEAIEEEEAMETEEAST